MNIQDILKIEQTLKEVKQYWSSGDHHPALQKLAALRDSSDLTQPKLKNIVALIYVPCLIGVECFELAEQILTDLEPHIAYEKEIKALKKEFKTKNYASLAVKQVPFSRFLLELRFELNRLTQTSLPEDSKTYQHLLSTDSSKLSLVYPPQNLAHSQAFRTSYDPQYTLGLLKRPENNARAQLIKQLAKKFPAEVYQTAVELYQQQAYEQALTLFATLASRAEIANTALVYQAQCLILQTQPERNQAISLLTQVITSGQTNLLKEAYFWRARAHLLNQNYQLAAADFEMLYLVYQQQKSKQAQIMPYYIEALQGYLLLLQEKAELSTALAISEKLLKLTQDKNVSIYIQQAQLFLALKKLPEAIESYGKAYLVKSQNPEITNLEVQYLEVLHTYLYQQVAAKQVEPALNWLGSLLEQASQQKNPCLHFAKAYGQLVQGKIAAAIASYSTAIDLSDKMALPIILGKIHESLLIHLNSELTVEIRQSLQGLQTLLKRHQVTKPTEDLIELIEKKLSAPTTKQTSKIQVAGQHSLFSLPQSQDNKPQQKAASTKKSVGLLTKSTATTTKFQSLTPKNSNPETIVKQLEHLFESISYFSTQALASEKYQAIKQLLQEHKTILNKKIHQHYKQKLLYHPVELQLAHNCNLTNFSKLRKQIGEWLNKEESIPLAQYGLTKVFERMPDQAIMCPIISKQLSIEKRYKAIIAISNAALSTPHLPAKILAEALYWRANAYQELGEYKKAITDYTEILVTDKVKYLHPDPEKLEAMQNTIQDLIKSCQRLNEVNEELVAKIQAQAKPQAQIKISPQTEMQTQTLLQPKAETTEFNPGFAVNFTF